LNFIGGGGVTKIRRRRLDRLGADFSQFSATPAASPQVGFTATGS